MRDGRRREVLEIVEVRDGLTVLFRKVLQQEEFDVPVEGLEQSEEVRIPVQNVPKWVRVVRRYWRRMHSRVRLKRSDLAIKASSLIDYLLSVILDAGDTGALPAV